MLTAANKMPWLVPPVAAGVFLRLYNIQPQILMDDEFHAIRAALYASYSYIFTHFGTTDHCIPLTLFYRLLATTTGLSEMLMRAPVVLAGILLCVALPLLLWRHSPVTAIASAWLIAISPFLLFYSRYCRPYLPALLLMSVVILAAWRLVRGASPRWFALLVPCAILAPWFHLTMMGPVGAVLLVLFLLLGWERRHDKARLVRLFLPFIAVAAGIAALIGAPMIIGFDQLKGTATSLTVPLTAANAFMVLQIHAGVSSVPLTIILLVLYAVGFVLVWRRDWMLAALLLIAALTQWAVNIIVEPAMSGVPGVCARYCILTVLLFAVSLASLIAAAVASTRRCVRAVAFGCSTVFVAALFLNGPVVPQLVLPNNWSNHFCYQDFAQRRTRAWQESLGMVRPHEYSDFYRDLAQRKPGSMRVIEVPWYYESWRNPYPYYQQLHRQHMAVGFIRRYGDNAWQTGDLDLTDTRLRFRHFVDMRETRKIRESGADYVIVHKRIWDEIPAFAQYERFNKPIAACIAKMDRSFGAPVFEDEYIRVYDPVNR